jgi:hypothetical protein
MMKKNVFGLAVVFLGFVLLFIGCASTTKIPWEFQDSSATILEGEWKEGGTNPAIYQFYGRGYSYDSIGRNGSRVPFEKGYFRILDGNLELLWTFVNKNYLLSILSMESRPVNWGEVNRGKRTAPTQIYSIDLQGDALILKLTGGSSVEKKDIGKTIKLNRATDS